MQISELENISNAIYNWSFQNDIFNQKIWEALPGEGLSLNQFVNSLANNLKKEVNFQYVTRRELFHDFPLYLGYEPLYKENELLLTSSNIFNTISMRPKPFGTNPFEYQTICAPSNYRIMEIDYFNKNKNLINEIQDILLINGEYLTRMWKRPEEISFEKIGTQIKCKSDIICEEFIIKKLKKITPNIPVMSEENPNSYSLIKKGLYWVLDPIDGTASFCKGFKGFVTQLALVENKNPLIGFVYAPILDLMYVSEANSGVTINNKIVKLLEFNKIKMIDNYPKPTGISKKIYDFCNVDEYLESGSRRS